MKATKNQADAVRAYLKGIGHEISHVQALEVIARGGGLRSRHAKTGQKSEAAPAKASEAELLDMHLNLSRVIELSGEIIRIGEKMKHMSNMDAVDLGYADAAQRLYEELGKEISSVRLAMHEQLFCAKCGTGLKDGYCHDKTCPYSDWPQSVSLYDIHSLSTSAIESKYGVTKRQPVEEAVPMTPGEKLRLKYGEDNEHPDYPRGDWLFEASKNRTLQTYWDWVATRLESIDSDELKEGLSPEARAKVIVDEYEASAGQAADVNRGVSRLMAECPSLFNDARKAWEFLNGEPHADREELTYLIQVESTQFGCDAFEYFSEQERKEGLIRLMAKAVELDDGAPRTYYFSEVDSELDKHSDEYVQALQAKEEVGSITEDAVVHYQGQRIGTIAEITADGLTLHSWIDEDND